MEVSFENSCIDVRKMKENKKQSPVLEKGLATASACRETRLRIRRQPGFQRIFGEIESKTGNGQSHSISTSPVF